MKCKEQIYPTRVIWKQEKKYVTVVETVPNLATIRGLKIRLYSKELDGKQISTTE